MMKYIGEYMGTERWLRDGAYYRRLVSGKWELETFESLVIVDDDINHALELERINYFNNLNGSNAANENAKNEEVRLLATSDTGKEKWDINGKRWIRHRKHDWEEETEHSLIQATQEEADDFEAERIEELRRMEENKIIEDQRALETDAEEKLQCWSVTHPDDFIEAILIMARQDAYQMILNSENIPRNGVFVCPPDTAMSYKIKQKMAILANKRAERNKRDGI
jgi:hypothetical protein